jgi:CheY-like chemotaxis protein
MSSAPFPVGLLLCDDLIFTSRITGTARSLGVTLRVARTPAALQQLAQQELPRCVLLDLGNSSLSVQELVPQLKSAGDSKPYIVAYGSHVDAAGLQAARTAGCDLVLPRSKFVEELPQQLLSWVQI